MRWPPGLFLIWTKKPVIKSNFWQIYMVVPLTSRRPRKRTHRCGRPCIQQMTDIYWPMNNKCVINIPCNIWLIHRGFVEYTQLIDKLGVRTCVIVRRQNIRGRYDKGHTNKWGESNISTIKVNCAGHHKSNSSQPMKQLPLESHSLIETGDFIQTVCYRKQWLVTICETRNQLNTYATHVCKIIPLKPSEGYAYIYRVPEFPKNTL